MKKITLFINLLIASLLLRAQSMEQGFQQLYYERYESAKNTFDQLVKQDPANAQTWYGLAKTLLLKNENASVLLNAPSSVHNEPYYEVAYGAVLLNNGKKDSAAMYFTKAIDRTKEKDAGILAAIAQAHIDSENGDPNYAVNLLNKAIKRDKRNASLYDVLGNAYRKLHNGSEAYKAYEAALKENSRYAAAYHHLGEIFLSQKNADVYVDYFNKAIAADPDYAPSYYKLYVHYFTLDPAKAMQYYNGYASRSDRTIETDYDLADLAYLNKNYTEAIRKAKNIFTQQGVKTKPRLYKLIAYSHVELKDSAVALTYMQQYFLNEHDSNLVAKDFETMADLFAQNNPDSAIVYYQKAAAHETDSTVLYTYYKKLADFSGSVKNYSSQARWLGEYYATSPKTNNIDLFNWALAHYRANEYDSAVSVFGKYTEKYPEQAFGYYWRARSASAIDTSMTQGLAVPYYQQVIEVLQTKDTSNVNYKKWITEAYSYLAAYEVNTNKNYEEAIGYFEKVLQVDPANEDARKYITMLEKELPEKGNK